MIDRDPTAAEVYQTQAAMERLEQIRQETPKSLEELQAFLCPRGFPTFDEFRKNPEKWRLSKDHLFEAIQGSMSIDRAALGKQKVYWRYSKEPMSLGKLERVVGEHGYKIEDCDMIGFRVKNSTGTGKDEILVRVFPWHELQAMGAVVPNS